MAAPARSLALRALRCVRWQLNYGGRLNPQGLVAPAFSARIEDFGDSQRRDFTNRSEVATTAETLPTDSANSYLDALITPIKNANLGHVPTGLDSLPAMNTFLRKQTLPAIGKKSGLQEIDEFILTSSQRDLREQLALVKRSGPYLLRLAPDLGETSALSTVMVDGSLETCIVDRTELGLQTRKEETRWASILGGGEETVRLSLLQEGNISFECSSVKRKRKKKMNKHKQPLGKTLKRR
ncbi:hypothetical protein R1sor_013106 [Riccia sorocarpa]|uniref:Mitochondrial mRNA-processing protein COX24 C-terminal domain-containing protein n=1 Tax=Riccia sorocarpa TaxID=122646 RepID=A0ABD3H8A4_9MARC